MDWHGSARLSPDEVSALIRKKDDVVADNMICFLYGREPLLVKPAPFFRALPSQTPTAEQTEQAELPKEKNLSLGFGMIAGFVLFSGTIPLLLDGATSEAWPLSLLMFAIGGFFVWLSRRYKN